MWSLDVGVSWLTLPAFSTSNVTGKKNRVENHCDPRCGDQQLAVNRTFLVGSMDALLVAKSLPLCFSMFFPCNLRSGVRSFLVYYSSIHCQ